MKFITQGLRWVWGNRAVMCTTARLLNFRAAASSLVVVIEEKTDDDSQNPEQRIPLIRFTSDKLTKKKKINQWKHGSAIAQKKSFACTGLFKLWKENVLNCEHVQKEVKNLHGKCILWKWQSYFSTYSQFTGSINTSVCLPESSFLLVCLI